MTNVTSILDLINLVPTLKLTHGELDADKPVVMAGDEPVFRVRNNDVGRAYANLIIDGLPLLAQLAGRAAGDDSMHLQALAQQPAPELSNQGAPAGELEALVRGRIEGVLKMVPEAKAKAVVMSNLVFAAVSPYLTGAPTHEPARPEPDAAIAQASIHQHRSQAVSEFIGWLAESGKLPLGDESALDEAFMQWEDAQNDGK